MLMVEASCDISVKARQICLLSPQTIRQCIGGNTSSVKWSRPAWCVSGHCGFRSRWRVVESMAGKSVISVKLEGGDIAKVDTIIEKLRGASDVLSANPGVAVLQRDEVAWLVERSQRVFSKESMLVGVEPPIAVCGDTHGQFVDLLRLFEKGRFPPETRYLFLGDYIDRGPNGIEVICLMMAYKVRYSDKFYVLRGNHETMQINRVYGFYDEVAKKYDKELYKKFNDCFDYMPLAALVSESILCMHGGISPDIESFDDIRAIKRPLTSIDDVGIACDLLWADPDDNSRGFQKSSRGISWLFGPDALVEFCERLGIDLVIRAHQVFDRGFQFFADRKLLTVFSAPDYCNQFNNAAGFVTIRKDFRMKIKSLRSKTLAGFNAPTGSTRSQSTQSSAKTKTS